MYFNILFSITLYTTQYICNSAGYSQCCCSVSPDWVPNCCLGPSLDCQRIQGNSLLISLVFLANFPHTRTHAYTHAHARTLAHTRAHTCTHTHTHAYTHAHARTLAHTRAHTCTHTHTHTHTHSLTHTHTHTHSLTHTHTHTHSQNLLAVAVATDITFKEAEQVCICTSLWSKAACDYSSSKLSDLNVLTPLPTMRLLIITWPACKCWYIVQYISLYYPCL